MKESPCKTCLVFPCCTCLCEEKIWYTSERIIRFTNFYNIEVYTAISHKIVSKCLQDLWKENGTITKHSDDRNSMLDSIFSIFETMKEKIKQEILIEGPAKNESFCNNLIKIFVGEKSA
jgi:hypothetical protein